MQYYSNIWMSLHDGLCTWLRSLRSWCLISTLTHSAFCWSSTSIIPTIAWYMGSHITGIGFRAEAVSSLHGGSAVAHKSRRLPPHLIADGIQMYVFFRADWITLCRCMSVCTYWQRDVFDAIKSSTILLKTSNTEVLWYGPPVGSTSFLLSHSDSARLHNCILLCSWSWPHVVGLYRICLCGSANDSELLCCSASASLHPSVSQQICYNVTGHFPHIESCWLQQWVAGCRGVDRIRIFLRGGVVNPHIPALPCPALPCPMCKMQAELQTVKYNVM